MSVLSASRLMLNVMLKELEEILGHWQHRGFIMRDSIEGNKSALEPKVRLVLQQFSYNYFAICPGLHPVESAQLPIFLLHGCDHDWVWASGEYFFL